MGRRTRDSINSEVELLDGQLQILSRREAEYQRIIGDIQKLRDEVSSEKATLTEKRNELESQKEPINWLPTELLVDIFIAFAEFDFEDLDYRPPVVISHTCTKWRAIALSTSRLWTRLYVPGSSSQGLAQTFFQRSGAASLDIGFFSLPCTLPSAQCEHMNSFLTSSRHHFSRIERLTLQCQTAASLLYILPFIQSHTSTFPKLRHLTLSISSPNPSFLEAPDFLKLETSATRNYSPPPAHSSEYIGLLHLKLDRVPLFSLPATLIANLKTLELSYAPRKSYTLREYYFLRMSTLCRFLSLTPLLEELVLSNTVPYFDVTLPEDSGPVINGNGNGPLVEMNPVVLKHLKSIDWTYPHTGDVARLLSMIEALALERLDLWVEEIRPKRHGACDDVLFTRGYTIASSPHKFIRGFTAAIYPALKDLSLQCAGDETAACVLRKFSVPALEKVAFTNMDTDARKGGEETPALPVFPRLESIFRDPRLPHLTHLTLSHFKLSAEQGRVEAMLGYMPLLTSLTLDTCLGVERLMDALQESLVGSIKPHDPAGRAKGGGSGRGTRSHCGVKVCPRLEALSFWGCQDVTLNSLSGVILSRNRRFSTQVKEEPERTHKSMHGPNGATQVVTRNSQTGKEGGGHKVEAEVQTGREIKPLRRMRQRHESALSSEERREGAATLSPSTNIVSTIIARQEALQPAHIIYLRVDNCKLIERAGALGFRDLGVVDLIWVGSD